MPVNFDGTGRFRPDPSLPAPWDSQPGDVAIVPKPDETPVQLLLPVVNENLYSRMRAELRTQMQQAWQRLDYKTADRIADILGEPRPTEHEKAY